MLVTVNLGLYEFANIPLFYVIIGSVILGLVIASLFQLVNNITTGLALRSKDQEIKKSRDKTLALTKRVHQLELEKQKNPLESDSDDENAL
jgi:hypothetical protein